jgi:hypothetical protein
MINLSHDHVVQKNAGKMLDGSHFIFIIIYFIFCHVFDLTPPSRPWVEQCLSVECGASSVECGASSVECGASSVECRVFQRQASGRLSVEHRRSSVEHQAFQRRASSVPTPRFEHRGSGIKHRVLMFECQVLSVKRQS